VLSPLDRQRLKERLAADLRDGKTVALPAGSDPDVSEAFPAVLAEVQAELGPPPLPGYELLAEIGRGGMSTVWLARQTSLQRKVALKFLPPGLEQSPKARKRMVHEAQVLGRLQHPHIVDVHDVIFDGDRVVMAMEWVEGRSLQQIVRGLPRPPAAPAIAQVAELLGAPPGPLLARGADWTAFAVGVVRDVALAAHAAHAQDLLHLDIKPANILLRRDGVAKLADFGVARDLEVLLTHTASFAGTPIYASPEQLARDDARIGPATDVYGLGITLYELLAREQPFSAKGITAALRRIERGGAPPLSRRVDVPADLESVVHRAIDPAPARRYASAADLAADLQAVLDGRPVTARPLTRARRFLRWARHEPWQAALLALAPAALLLLGVLLSEWSSIATVHRARAHEQSLRLMQSGFTEFFVIGAPGAEVRGDLERALAAEPDSPLALAALATVLADHDGGAAAAALAAHPGEVAAHRGLQLLQAQAQDRRSCLGDAQFDELQRSGDAIDLFTAALGHVVLAQERSDGRAYERALWLLRRVDACSEVANPLVKGLLAVCAANAGDERCLELAQDSLRMPGLDPVQAMLWNAVALENVRPDEAIAACRAFLERHGGELRIHQTLLNMLGQQHRHDEVQQQIDAMAAAGMPPDAVRRSRLIAWAAAGRKDDLLRELRPDDFTDTAAHLALRSRLLEKYDAAAAIDCCRRGLPAADPVLAAELQYRIAELLLARKPPQVEDGVAALCAAVDARPEHAMYRWRLAHELAYHKQYAAARPHFDRLRAAGLRRDEESYAMMRSYEATHDYDLMLQYAEQWQKMPGEAVKAANFVDIALSRLGRIDEARQELEKDVKSQKPYVEAFVELAWLRVDPSRERDPAAAALALRDVVGVLKSCREHKHEPGPWLLYVLAEAQFANGRREDAAASAAAALQCLAAAEPEAPPDLAQRLEAALRRFQAAPEENVMRRSDAPGNATHQGK
jgi:serine/threonine protein kinase